MRTYYITQGTLLNALWWPEWKLRMLWGQKYLTENRHLTEGCTEHSLSLQTVNVKERGSKRGRESNLSLSVLSRVWLFESPWTVARQAPLSMRFHRQEYWSALPFPPPPGDHSNPGIRDRTQVSSVSYIGRQILYHPATWEALGWASGIHWILILFKNNKNTGEGEEEERK